MFTKRPLAGGEQGSQLVEAAIIFQVLLMLMIGMFWMGRAYNVYQTITRAAREGARFALAPSCSTCSSPNSFPSDSDVTTVVNNALSASSLDSTQVNPAISISRNTVLNPSDPSSTQVAGVVVSFGYPVKLTIPFTTLNASTVTISTQVRMRQEF